MTHLELNKQEKPQSVLLELLCYIGTRQEAVVDTRLLGRWYFNRKLKWNLLYSVITREVRWCCVRGVPILKDIVK
jgi:hypothetical protein